jgi:hypothetical protein
MCIVVVPWHLLMAKKIVMLLPICLGNNSCVFLQPLRGWVYRDSYTGPLWVVQGHMGHSHTYTYTYTLTPPPPAIWTTGASVYKTDKQRKKLIHKRAPPQAQLATGCVEAGLELREDRGRKTLGEDVCDTLKFHH